MLEQALEYVRQGWYVLPLRGKVPATPHGVKDASMEVAQAVAWWAGSERYNVGIATGPSGLLVVDLDGDAAVERWAAATPRPRPTLVATTGRGQHWYYRGEGRSTAGLLGVGVDTRGLGGYVVAPPSVHPTTGGRYEWASQERVAPLPDDLAEALRPRRFRPRAPLPGWSDEGNVKALCADVRGARVGMRNNALNRAAYNARALGTPSTATVRALVGVGLELGLREQEVLRTVASGLGLTYENVMEDIAHERA